MDVVYTKKPLTGVRQALQGKRSAVLPPASRSVLTCPEVAPHSDCSQQNSAPAIRSSAGDTQALQDKDTEILLLILSLIPPHPSPPEHAD